MSDIHELNRRRVEASYLVEMLGYVNAPTKTEDVLKSDARYRLAVDARNRAENDYQRALAALSADELRALTIVV